MYIDDAWMQNCNETDAMEGLSLILGDRTFRSHTGLTTSTDVDSRVNSRPDNYFDQLISVRMVAGITTRSTLTLL